MTNYTERKCKDCRHWHQVAEDDDSPIIKPTTDGSGYCRQGLHVIGVQAIQRTLAGNIPVTHLNAVYPTLPPDWPACSHFQEQVPGAGKLAKKPQEAIRNGN